MFCYYLLDIVELNVLICLFILFYLIFLDSMLSLFLNVLSKTRFSFLVICSFKKTVSKKQMLAGALFIDSEQSLVKYTDVASHLFFFIQR